MQEMQQKTKRFLDCPECGKETFVYYDPKPELRESERLIEHFGWVEHKCNHCGEQFMVQIHIKYQGIDESTKISASLFPIR
jgi:transcription elongation factor Elf1